MVSSMLSPLTREDSCTSRFTTSAPRRLAASSNDTRVRVDGSVNRLATVMPARLSFCTGGSPTGFTNFCARVSSASICCLDMPSSVSRCRSVPLGRVCSVMSCRCFSNQRSRITAAAAASTSSRVTRRRRSPLARCSRRRSSASCEDQRSSTRSTGSEQRVCELGGEAARGLGERARASRRHYRARPPRCAPDACPRARVRARASRVRGDRWRWWCGDARRASACRRWRCQYV